jgi:hypothetical protein
VPVVELPFFFGDECRLLLRLLLLALLARRLPALLPLVIRRNLYGGYGKRQRTPERDAIGYTHIRWLQEDVGSNIIIKCKILFKNGNLLVPEIDAPEPAVMPLVFGGRYLHLQCQPVRE